MFCTKCGHKNKTNANFCSKCGNKLNIIENDITPKKTAQKSMSLEKVFQVVSVPFGIAFFAVARVAFRTLIKYWSNNS
tara:strand:- start:506 stop:739 length:234 start_codon:yes stop_codon:yes gene_type:complete